MAVMGLVTVGLFSGGFMLYVLIQWTRETIGKPKGTAFGDDGGEAEGPLQKNESSNLNPGIRRRHDPGPPGKSDNRR